ncbi:unnamed protein product, partial [Amoebophrya sp. A120]
GILFNHESPRRGGTFVTKKVTTGVAQICAGIKDRITLGNLDAKRDWGLSNAKIHAYDYVRGMWMMLQQDVPEDFYSTSAVLLLCIIATGRQYSVRDLCELSFRMYQMQILSPFENSIVHEEGVDTVTGKVVIGFFLAITYYRPTEVETLLGDPTKAKKKMGWKTEIGYC